MIRWAATSRAWDRIKRYPLSIAFFLASVIIFSSSIAGLHTLRTLAQHNAQTASLKEQDSALALFSSFLESPDGEVVLANVEEFGERTRALSPLILNQSFFRSIPRKLETQPASPPRSCFLEVDAFPLNSGAYFDRASICAYVTTDRRIGSWINLDIVVPVATVDIHEPGSPLSDAQGIQLSLRRGETFVTYYLVFQPPQTSKPTKGKQSNSGGGSELPQFFQVTAYERSDQGTPIALSKGRFEGWGYQIVDSEHGQRSTRILARVDVKAIYAGRDYRDLGNVWPPPDIRQTRLVISPRGKGRRAIWASNNHDALSGTSAWSLPKLYDNFIGKELYLFQLQKAQAAGNTSLWKYPPSSRDTDGPDVITRLFSGWMADGTPIQPAKKSVLAGKYFVFVQPITADLESIKTGWAWILWILLVTGCTAFGLFIYVFVPIFNTARQINALSSQPLQSERLLTSRFPRTEIGRSTTAFNELLMKTRQQAHDAATERNRRVEDEHRRRAEDMAVREVNLRTIGHEIRSPLHALRELHKDDVSLTRRYIERMTRAIQLLYGAASIEDAFASVEVTLEKVDAAQYVYSIARNSERAGIQNVQHSGPISGAYAMLDVAAFEDSVTHVLTNAKRYRSGPSAIRLSFEIVDRFGVVGIANEGPTIPEHMLERIFDYGVSLDPESGLPENHGQGLFMARRYLRTMDASIRAKNMIGGVLFEIIFPLA